MKKIFLLAVAVIALTACNNSDDNLISTSEPVKVTATIGGSGVSRASDVSWHEGDAIGITMGDRYTNIRYSTEAGNEKFTGTTMYFTNKSEQLSITAYYPFGGTETSEPGTMEASTKADFQTEEEQPNYDFLYAGPVNVSGASPNVNLTFFHKMCKLTFIFKKGNDGTDVSKITSYTIEGLVHDGTFNPATGECAAKSDVDSTPITINPESVAHNSALPSLLLFPQTVDKLTLKIKDSEDQDYKCELKFPENLLSSGNNYLFTITVKKTALVVNSRIENWNPVIIKDNPDAISDDTEESEDSGNSEESEA